MGAMDALFTKKIKVIPGMQGDIEVAVSSYLDGTVGSILLYSAGPKDGVTWQTYQGSTAEGLWPESSLKTVKSKLGQPLKELPQAIVYPGLWIRLDSKGQIESFSISKDEANQLKELGD